MVAVSLKAGREKSILRRHPWIFSGAIARIQGEAQPGETVDVVSSQGVWLARGAYSPHSQIAVRIWSFEQAEHISAEFFRRRLQRAIETRRHLAESGDLTAYRVVHAESDGLPGVVIDRYENFFVCQFLSAGAEYWKREIVAQLTVLVDYKGIYERSDVDVRGKEGLQSCTGILAGEVPPDVVEIREHALRFLVDIQRGHKTGFYLDQRDNRLSLAEYTQGADVLNCFAYTGGFGMYALKNGAKSVTNIEASASAIEMIGRHIELNGMDGAKSEQVQDDVFKVLRRYRDSRRQFDLIVLDPPKFAESKSQLKGACRGYKDINLLTMKLLRPGGLLLTFSCSGLMTPDLFQKIVADAALDAKRDAQIVKRLAQASDHPIALNFPEGHYLKGLVCRVW